MISRNPKYFRLKNISFSKISKIGKKRQLPEFQPLVRANHWRIFFEKSRRLFILEPDFSDFLVLFTAFEFKESLIWGAFLILNNTLKHFSIQKRLNFLTVKTIF